MVLAEQTYEGGSEYPTLHYTFYRLLASPVLATYPLMIGLQNVNDVAMSELLMSGPITGTFTYNQPPLAAPLAPLDQTYDWTVDTGWSLTPTGDGQCDLEINFGVPHAEWPALPADAEIRQIEMEFVMFPEPSTFLLLGLVVAVPWRRRR